MILCEFEEYINLWGDRTLCALEAGWVGYRPC